MTPPWKKNTLQIDILSSRSQVLQPMPRDSPEEHCERHDAEDNEKGHEKCSPQKEFLDIGLANLECSERCSFAPAEEDEYRV